MSKSPSNSTVKPRIFVISAPSATGKTTLTRRLIQEHPNVEVSVSLTARPIRPKERDTVDYHFVTKAEFERRIAAQEMLEFANVHGNYYGTSRKVLDQIIARGHIAILVIDVQGWQQARRLLPNAHAIFIVPPNLESLWKRMELRGADSLETRWRRLLNAKHEIEHAADYDYFLVNDTFEHAYEELQDIVINGKSGHLERSEGIAMCTRLIQEFESAPWLRELRLKFSPHG